MAFAPSTPWKLPCIITWDGSRNQNLPTDSAEEAENGTTLSYCCSPDWVYEHARSLRWAWTTSIGTTASSPFGARVGGGHKCRCRPTSVRLSLSTCAQVVRAASAAVFSFDIALPSVVLHTRLQFPRSSGGR